MYASFFCDILIFYWAPFTLLTLPLNKAAHDSVEFMTEQRIIHQKRDEEK